MSSAFHEDPRTSRRSCLRWLAAAALTPMLARATLAACPCGDDDTSSAGASASATTQPSTCLRVCADPNNLPYSNRRHEGFEDKIAALVADDLGLALQSDWLPQRLGFFRTAFKTFESDLVMAAPAGFDKALITNPYYRSTYVFVGRRGGAGLPKSLDDPALRKMKIGVQLAGNDTPPTHALARRKLIDNVTGYPVFDESNGKPAEKIVADVAAKKIDVAIVWGPQAGFFVKQQADALQMVPVSPEEDGEGREAMPFTFAICMAVRRSDAHLRDRLNGAIARRQKEIDRILDDFAVPRLELHPHDSAARG